MGGTTITTLPNVNLGDLLKLAGLPSKATASERANELVRRVVSVIDDLVASVMEKRTAAEFVSVRAEVFPQYFSVMRALGDLTGVVIPKQTIERLSAEWFSELEAEFKNRGPATIGPDLAERGIFTVWILRKISGLAQEIMLSPPATVARDIEMANQFAAQALWTRFHLDCLTKSMRANVPIYPGVIGPIRDGLRTAVNTYASIRQWADLRGRKPEPELGPIEWTGEDELLLTDSMRDLDRETA